MYSIEAAVGIVSVGICAWIGAEIGGAIGFPNFGAYAGVLPGLVLAFYIIDNHTQSGFN
jgi:hypothetical protein